MKNSKSFARISSGMAIGSFATFLSRITGLVRDIIYANFWGTGNALGAFLVAFTIPNLFRRIIGEGALGEAFVPSFTEKLSKSGRQSAYLFAFNVLTIIGFLTLILVIIGIFLCIIFEHLATEKFAVLTFQITPILLPYTFFICIVGILGGIVNSLNHFAIPALSPIILNGAIIAGVLFVLPLLGNNELHQFYGLSLIILLAGFIQLCAFIPILKKNEFSFRLNPRILSPDIKKLTRLVIPGIIGASVLQCNVIVDRLFASWLGGYAVTSLYYSERLIYLPIGVFAVALATACLPEFTRAYIQGNINSLIDAMLYSLRHIFYLTLPCVVFMFLLAQPIVSLLFQRGDFDHQSLQFTLEALMYYLPGIPAFAAVKILRAGFYSRKDMITPVKISCYCLLVNVVLNFMFIGPLKHSGIALATTISSYLNLVILFLSLTKLIDSSSFPIRNLTLDVVRMSGGLTISGIVVWFINCQFPVHENNSFISKLGVVLIPMVIGTLLYVIITVSIGSKQPAELCAIMRKKK